MMAKRATLALLTLVLGSVRGQQDVNGDCSQYYSGGSIAGAVIGTLAAVFLLAALAYLLWKHYWEKRKGKTLTNTADAEAGLADQQYAFDNPGFLTEDSAATLPSKKPPIKAKPTTTDPKAVIETKNLSKENKSEIQKAPKHSGKWQAWSPLSALVGGGSGKHKENRRTLDDSFIGEPERNVIALRGHDFTGLGFNICGNMRDGIFVRDVLHRGPASESGRIAAGDRILGINISFKHMVFEDALTILSYASPYDVQLEVEKSAPGSTARDTGSGKRSPSVGPTDRLCHPFYRSQSIDDLAKMRRSSLSARKAKIKKSPSNSPGPVGVLGAPASHNSSREDAKLEQASSAADNPRTSRTSVSMPKPERAKKPNGKSTEETKTSLKAATPPTVDKHTKFGIRVLPPNIGEIKLASGASETTQNEQNTKIELKTSPMIDTEQKMQDITSDLKGNPNTEDDVEKTPDTSVYSIRVDEDVTDTNIPTEIPEEMRLAAIAAKTNRKSLSIDKLSSAVVVPAKPEIHPKPELDFSSGGESAADGNDTPRKNAKRKAPPPPSVPKTQLNPHPATDSDDSDVEPGDSKGKGGGKTIELNSAHITIHQSPKEEENVENNDATRNRDRKTASLGDLSRLESEHPMSIPLERAVSLDMADVTAPVSVAGADPAISGTAKKRKAPVVPDDDDAEREVEGSDEENSFSIPSHHFAKKEPRLMDAGMSDTFRRRLKKSSDWGTLEEALLVSATVEQPSIITQSSSHHIVLVSGSEPTSLQSSTVSSSNKSPSLMQSSDVISVQVVTSSTPEPTSSSVSNSLSPVEATSSEPVVDSTSMVELVSTTVEFTNMQQDAEENSKPPELPTSPMPKAQTSVREFSLASPNNSPTSNFHHSMTYITTTTPTISPQHHVTEIQVLTGGNVSTTAPFITENVESTASVRHGTSGGNLLLLPSLTTGLMNGPDSLEETLSSFTSTQSEVEDEPIIRLESPVGSNVTVMSINTNGITNHTEHNSNLFQDVTNKIMDTLDNKEHREILQITPGELDSVMMSHSHYLMSTQSPEPAACSSSTFEQWVFLDNGGTPVNGIRHLESPNPNETDSTGVTKSNTTTTVVNLPNLQSVTHIMLDPDSKSEKESKNKLNVS